MISIWQVIPQQRVRNTGANTQKKPTSLGQNSQIPSGQCYHINCMHVSVMHTTNLKLGADYLRRGRGKIFLFLQLESDKSLDDIIMGAV